MLAGFENRHDAGCLSRARALASRTNRECKSGSVSTLARELESHLPVERAVPGEIDHAKAAAADVRRSQIFPRWVPAEARLRRESVAPAGSRTPRRRLGRARFSPAAARRETSPARATACGLRRALRRRRRRRKRRVSGPASAARSRVSPQSSESSAHPLAGGQLPPGGWQMPSRVPGQVTRQEIVAAPQSIDKTGTLGAPNNPSRSCGAVEHGRVVGEKLDLRPESRQHPIARLVDPGRRLAEILAASRGFTSCIHVESNACQVESSKSGRTRSRRGREYVRIEVLPARPHRPGRWPARP